MTGFINADSDLYTNWNTNLTITPELDVSEVATGGGVLSGATFNSMHEWYDQQSSSTKERTVCTVVITLDFAKLATASTPLITLNGNGNITGLGLTNDRKLTGMWTNNSAYFTVADELGNSGIHTVTFSFSNDGTTIYVDGAIAGKNSGLRGDLDNIGTITLSAAAVGAMQSLQVYDKAAYDDSAFGKSTMALIPEPTTATLSLLALAGLAARRR